MKKADGTFQTVLEQRGTVEAVSSTAITVEVRTASPVYASRGTDGFSASRRRIAGNGRRRHRLKPRNGTIADIATGDVVRVAGVQDGGTATAQRIVEGGGDRPGPGLGRGHGHGHGREMGTMDTARRTGRARANPSGSGA